MTCSLRSLLYAISLGLFLSSARAQPIQAPPPGIDELIVVLRPAPGTNNPHEALRPVGRVKTILPWTTNEIEVEPSWFDFIGDMRVCLYFKGTPSAYEMVTPADLERLDLSPEEAIEIAVANTLKLDGPPQTEAHPEGAIGVYGEHEDRDSSYFLDRQFWQGQLKRHPEGLVVALPRRYALMFAPLTDTDAVEYLREGVPGWYEDTDVPLSTALYLFKDDQWSVYQPPRP